MSWVVDSFVYDSIIFNITFAYPLNISSSGVERDILVLKLLDPLIFNAIDLTNGYKMLSPLFNEISSKIPT